MSSPEKSSESIAYLPGASANGSEPQQAEAVDPPIVQAPPALSEPSAAEAQARLEALQSSNTTIMDELKAERMKVVELTADAAKYKAESAMKDKHIELLQVIRLQYREAALARSSARRPPPRGIVWSRVSRVSRPRGSR